MTPGQQRVKRRMLPYHFLRSGNRPRGTETTGFAPMDMMLFGLGLGIGAVLLMVTALVFARAGSLSQGWWGLTVAGYANRNPSLGAKIDALVGNPASALPSIPTSTPVPTAPLPPPKPTGEALRVLTLLQADARFIDFFMETLPAKLTDDQVGGVLDVHKKIAAALRKYLILEPVLPQADGERVTVPKGFDPSAIRVLGNVTGEPPYNGELQHAGWKVKELKVPAIAEGQDPFVLQPAEVQM